MMIDINIT